MGKPAHPHVDKALAYCRGVVDGSIDNCRLVKLACQRHLDDLERAKKGWGYRFDPGKAERVCRFMELFPHVKGRWARSGEPMVLEPFQCFLTCAIFGWVSVATNLRRFRRAYIEKPRKMGKSFWAGLVGDYMFAADGEPGAEVYCLDAATRVLCGDFQYRHLGDLAPGDELIAFDENPPKRNGLRRFRWTRITSADRVILPSYLVRLEDGREVVCSGEHRWFVRPPRGTSYQWRTTERLGAGWRIRDLGRVWNKDDSREGGYLAGIYDGEGWLRSTAPGRRSDRNRSGFNIGFSQNPGSILSHVRASLETRGFTLSANRGQMSSKTCETFEMRGASQCFRFLGEIAPGRLIAAARDQFEGMSTNRAQGSASDADARVVSVVPVGDKELVAVQTSTRTLIAEGLFSHNSGANTEAQAHYVFGQAWSAARLNREFLDYYGVEISGTIKNPRALYRASDRSVFKAVIGKPGDGASPHCAIVDEYHEADSPDLVEAMQTGMGARAQPLLLMITTAGSNTGSPCYQQHQEAEQVLEGVVTDDQLFTCMWGIDAEDDWRTEEALVKANPNIGVSVSYEYLRDQQQQAIQSARKQASVLIKHFCRWISARHPWINPEHWHPCDIGAVNPRDYLDHMHYAALDLSSKSDVTALQSVFARLDERRYVTTGRYYIPEDNLDASSNAHAYRGWIADGHLQATPGSMIDQERIFADVMELHEMAPIAVACLDPWNAGWIGPRLMDEGIEVLEIPQTTKYVSDPMKAIEAMLPEKRLRHDGNPVLTWGMLNVVAKEDARDNLFPRKERPENKIDPARALLMAMYPALLGMAGDGGPSVYESRGIIAL